ncbi:hypothetical protein ACJX0J_027051, partial [Zea mays]
GDGHDPIQELDGEKLTKTEIHGFGLKTSFLKRYIPIFSVKSAETKISRPNKEVNSNMDQKYLHPGGAHVEVAVTDEMLEEFGQLVFLEGFMTEVENSWLGMYRKRKNFIGKLKKHVVWNFYNNLLGGRSIHDNFMMNLAEVGLLGPLLRRGGGQWVSLYADDVVLFCGQGALIDKVAAKLPGWKAANLNLVAVLTAIPIYHLIIRRGFLWKGRTDIRGGHCHKKKGFNSIVILVAWQIWKHRNALYYGQKGATFKFQISSLFLADLEGFGGTLLKIEFQELDLYIPIFSVKSAETKISCDHSIEIWTENHILKLETK